MQRTAFLLLLLLCALPSSAHASDGDTAFLQDLDTARFPQVSAFLAMADAQGTRPAGLRLDELTLREDGVPVAEPALADELVGLQWVLVLAPDNDMIRAGSRGARRLDAVRAEVAGWLGRFADSTLDDLTLITPEGTAVSHTHNVTEFLEALARYEPALPSGRTLDEMLMDAIGAAADPTARPGMRRAILLVTSSDLRNQAETAVAACPRAVESRVLFQTVWAGRESGPRIPDIDALRYVAGICAGSVVLLEDAPAIASIFSGLSTQRSQYKLEYRSAAGAAGAHGLSAQVSRADFSAETPAASFLLNVQSPLVTWGDLPDTIERTGTDALQPVEEFEPQELSLSAAVSFPDGVTRQIVAVRLYVDDVLVSECAQPPCPAILWDLRPYSSGGVHRLRLVVLDELGLAGETEEREIRLVVNAPSAVQVFLARYSVALAVGLMVAGALAALVVSGAVMRKMTPGRRSRRMIPEELSPPPVADRIRGWIRARADRSPRPEPEQEPEGAPRAVFEALDSGVESVIFASDQAVAGSQSGAVQILLDDASVAPAHARLACLQDGTIWVFDLGSTAGTWVNFEEVPETGRALHEGDRLQFGRAAFRVRLQGLPLAGAEPAAPEES